MILWIHVKCCGAIHYPHGIKPSTFEDDLLICLIQSLYFWQINSRAAVLNGLDMTGQDSHVEEPLSARMFLDGL